MEPLELALSILQSGEVETNNGVKFPLYANIDQQEGLFLYDLVKKLKPAKSIEVGCAYGLSSLFISSALKAAPEKFHTIIDPNQSTEFKNIGLHNLEKADVDFVRIIEKPSEIALPELLSSGEKFDFAFIDGWHTFDHTLIDFFYINRLLSIGGVVVIDDIGLPAVNKLLRYIKNYPSYQQIASLKMKDYRKSVAGSILKSPFRLINILLPKKLQYRVFAANIIKSDSELNLNSSMVALKKIKADERSWDWFADF